MGWFAEKVDSFIRSIRDDPDLKRIPIGEPPDDPTYWRWFVLPRNRFLNIYLHNFRKDDAHDLHDHRAANISFLLQGEYYDERYECRPIPGLPLPRTRLHRRPQYSFTFRRAATPHRVVLHRDSNNLPIHVWSLFIKFPDFRDWGFWCPGNLSARWVPWQQHAITDDPNSPLYGQLGRGCDE